MSDRKQVFVSYSRADKDKVFPLVKNLEKSVGTKFWIDLEGIESTAQFLNVIRQAIEDSQVVLFMLSDNSINGEWTQREIMFAKECGKRVVPVILDGGGLRDWTKLYFANVNYVDAKNKHQVEKLSKEITEWIESEVAIESTDSETTVTPSPRSVAKKKVLWRVNASQKTIILVATALIVILCVIGLCMVTDKEGQDEEKVQNTELINEGDTLPSSAESDASIATTENVKNTQASAIENSSNDKVDISSKQSSTTSIVTMGNVKKTQTSAIENSSNDKVVIPSAQSSTTSSTAVQSSTTGTINGHAYVDLGLSVKWATCNVGASSPEGYGNYFAWGETSTKPEYTEANTKTFDNSTYNYDIGGNASLDAARANWGGTWCLPTKAEMTELKDKCTWTWTTQGGKNGYKVTGPSGKSIFLPAAGFREGLSLRGAGVGGVYWSSTPNEVNAILAYVLSFNSGRLFMGWDRRDCGRPIRPVSD